MAADDLGKNEIGSIREYIQKVEAGFEKLDTKFEKLDQKLQEVWEWQIRAEEQRQHYVTNTALNDRIVPLENRVQLIEKSAPNYVQRSTMNEKIVGTLVAIGIAVLTAVLTSIFTK